MGAGQNFHYIWRRLGDTNKIEIATYFERSGRQIWIDHCGQTLEDFKNSSHTNTLVNTLILSRVLIKPNGHHDHAKSLISLQTTKLWSHSLHKVWSNWRIVSENLMTLWLPPEIRDMCLCILVSMCPKSPKVCVSIAFSIYVVPFEVAACPTRSSRPRMSFSVSSMQYLHFWWR